MEYSFPKITEEEYKVLEEFDKKSGNTWTKKETEYVLELLEMFHGNFLLVHDRFDENLHGKARTVEDLKERVYFALKLTKAAGINLKDVYYDKQNEEIRKLRTERYMSRNCLLYTSPSPRDLSTSRMPSSA